MKLFSGNANTPLAQKVSALLKIPISPIEFHVFPDGEKRVMIQDNVVDQDTVIIQPTGVPVNENYMELFFIVDALKRSGARTVTCVMPYLGYQRQDHVFRIGESASLHVVVKTLELVGCDRFIFFDLHSIKIPEFFNTPVVHLSALGLFAKKIKEMGWHNTDSVIVSPDMGGIRRIRILSELLGNMPYAMVEKNRDLASGNVTADVIQGNLAKRALIVDDMISSGKTIEVACNLLARHGVQEMYVFATHPIFSGAAPYILQASLAQKIYVTDTIDVTAEKLFPKLEIISVAGKISDTLTSS